MTCIAILYGHFERAGISDLIVKKFDDLTNVRKSISYELSIEALLDLIGSYMEQANTWLIDYPSVCLASISLLEIVAKCQEYLVIHASAGNTKLLLAASK